MFHVFFEQNKSVKGVRNANATFKEMFAKKQLTWSFQRKLNVPFKHSSSIKILQMGDGFIEELEKEVWILLL